MQISHHLARQIVEAAAAAISGAINLIDPGGIIIGSTDKTRLGTFHAAGYQAIKNNQIITVDANDEPKGTKTGINYPIVIEGQAIAAIGITGEPAQVSSFGTLVTKICEVFLKEQLVEKQLNSQERLSGYIVHSLIQNDITNRPYFESLLEHFDLDSMAPFVALSLKLPQPEIVGALQHYFSRLGGQLQLLIYPDELVVLLPAALATHFDCEDFAKRYPGQAVGGEGSAVPLLEIRHSYTQAALCRKYADRRGLTWCRSEDISTELVFAAVPHETRRAFAAKILKALNDRERQLLTAYLNNDLSLKETALELHIHKNTLQYQLAKVTAACGYNPRNFHDAFTLQLALLLS